jgi:hypothetical protein
MSSIYKALSEIYEQPIVRKRRDSKFQSFGKPHRDDDNKSYAYTLKSSISNSKGNDKRARSVASLSRSKHSTTRADSFPHLSKNTILGTSPIHPESKLKSSLSSSSYSYAVRNQSGTLIAVGPSNYKIMGFDKTDDLNLKSPTSRYYENETTTQTMKMISPMNLTYTEKDIHPSGNYIAVQMEDDKSKESDFSPLMAEAAQLRALVDETLTLVDAHYSPTSRQKLDLNSNNNKKSFQESIDSGDTFSVLSSTAKDILSLLSSIHVGDTGNHMEQIEEKVTDLVLPEEKPISDSLPLHPPVQPVLNDVLNDDEETFMLSRTHRLR